MPSIISPSSMQLSYEVYDMAAVDGRIKMSAIVVGVFDDDIMAAVVDDGIFGVEKAAIIDVGGMRFIVGGHG